MPSASWPRVCACSMPTAGLCSGTIASPKCMPTRQAAGWVHAARNPAAAGRGRNAGEDPDEYARRANGAALDGVPFSAHLRVARRSQDRRSQSGETDRRMGLHPRGHHRTKATRGLVPPAVPKATRFRCGSTSKAPCDSWPSTTPPSRTTATAATSSWP